LSENRGDELISLLHGDALAVLRTLPDESVQCCVTSPPYWGLRDYGAEGQLGLESSPDTYVANLVAVFREVNRVLKRDGTLWLNLGDSYVSQGGTGHQGKHGERHNRSHTQRQLLAAAGNFGLKQKDLAGIPWRVAFALRDNGWYLRSDIIWHKPNVMPESVRDRPTKSHEYLFLFAKSDQYFYDADAIKEPVSAATEARCKSPLGGPKIEALAEANKTGVGRRTGMIGMREAWKTRNKRTVWTVTTAPFRGAHFATFPPNLVRPCILAGSRPGDVVLDPFNGAGTTGLVALETGRSYVGIDINAEYLELTRRRLGIVEERPA
jgi:DNA modification methylase